MGARDGGIRSGGRKGEEGGGGPGGLGAPTLDFFLPGNWNVSAMAPGPGNKCYICLYIYIIYIYIYFVNAYILHIEFN